MGALVAGQWELVVEVEQLGGVQELTGVWHLVGGLGAVHWEVVQLGASRSCQGGDTSTRRPWTESSLGFAIVIRKVCLQRNC